MESGAPEPCLRALRPLNPSSAVGGVGTAPHVYTEVLYTVARPPRAHSPWNHSFHASL